MKNEQLLDLSHAPICNHCDVYSCNRCKYLNKKLTGEINTPSKNQCLVNHIQREVSMELQNRMKKDGIDVFVNLLVPIDYRDPLEKIINK